MIPSKAAKAWTQLYGEGGDDYIYGGADRDWLFGGDNNDHLFGEGGPDEMYGDSGDDELYGGESNDLLDGGPGMDILVGGEGADWLTGGSEPDRFLFINGNLFETDSPSSNPDMIMDYNWKEGDIIVVEGSEQVQASTTMRRLRSAMAPGTMLRKTTRSPYSQQR